MGHDGPHLFSRSDHPSARGGDARCTKTEPAAGRDESLPAPGWTLRLSGGLWNARRPEWAGNRKSQADVCGLTWRIYDREHGYAPAAPRLDRFRALAERMHKDGALGRIFARELLAVVEEVERG